MRCERARGRGTGANPTGRFEPYVRESFDDGWGTHDENMAPPATEVRYEKTDRIIATNQSPDVPFDQSINPYKGCEHGCIYCYARPTHAYLGLSPGLDFERVIVAKPQGPERLRVALAKPSYRCQPIALGANTDPYQPVERSEKITRGILEVLWEHRHPVTIVTKSNLILRDAELLATLAEHQLVSVILSVTTLDRDLARRMEPRAATPQKRLEAIAHLNELGVPVGVLVSPIIPAINDAELESIMEACRSHGAAFAGTILLRLPHELQELFEGWLDENFPDRKEKVVALLREARGGKINEARFGRRMTGTGPYAQLLNRRFELAHRRLGFEATGPRLDTSSFRRPGEQLGLWRT